MTKHKVFISYHHDDEDEVQQFCSDFDESCIIRGVFTDDIIQSDDRDYIMRKIREKYLTDSTVTIVLIGKCTWARKYVDWEIASTLRNDTNNKRSGLMAIALPSINNNGTLPARFKDNMDSGYAKFWSYPTSTSGLDACIEEAFQARTALGDKVDNTRDLRKNNGSC